MNKKLLTLAIGAALVAGPIAARAEVTVYGHGHLSVDMLTADYTVTTNEDTSIQVVNNSSRFGIRASEDLGGGLKGEVQYELAFTNLETTTGTVATNRDNFIGLAGGFGAIRLGVIDGAVKDAGGVADLFYREQLGESRAIINANASQMDNRVMNGLHYFSPSIGGWVIKAQYGYELEQTLNAADNESTMMQVGAKGKIGPVALGVGYMNVSRPTNDTSGIRVGAKVTFGGFDIAALYQTVTDIAATIGNDQNAYGLGAGFKIGKNYIKGQIYIADELGGVADTGAKQLSVGYDYLFSKTTKVYVTYAKVESDGGTFYGVGGGGHGATATTNVSGGTSSGISAGMIMDF
jgi:predicted porin